MNDSLNFVEQSAAYNAVSDAQGALKVALPLARNQHIDSLKATTGIRSVRRRSRKLKRVAP